ncbi:MAG: hypothetical protein AAF543_09005 [Pseudomonadota bacterium]
MSPRGGKAYENLAETEDVDLIVSGSIDGMSLGWLPRVVEYKIPTLNTWTSYIGIIDMLVEDYETQKMYFMNIASKVCADIAAVLRRLNEELGLTILIAEHLYVLETVRIRINGMVDDPRANADLNKAYFGQQRPA